MQMLAKVAIAGLLLSGLSFAKHPKYDRWRDNQSSYRVYDRDYRNPGYRYDNNRYRDYRYNNRGSRDWNSFNRGYTWRRNVLPPGLERRYQRKGTLPRGWQNRPWRRW